MSILKRFQYVCDNNDCGELFAESVIAAWNEVSKDYHGEFMIDLYGWLPNLDDNFLNWTIIKMVVDHYSSSTKQASFLIRLMNETIKQTAAISVVKEH